MRYLSIILLSVLFIPNSHAQIYEVGVFAGGSNFIGDVGATNYISPNSPAFGGIFKWNRSPRHAWRLSVTFTELEGIDADSDDPRRIERDYEFQNNILEYVKANLSTIEQDMKNSLKSKKSDKDKSKDSLQKRQPLSVSASIRLNEDT